MKTLPKLSEYVTKLENSSKSMGESFWSTKQYKNFIIQPLNLSHFVPAIFKDGKWIVLEKYIKTISEEYWDNNSICRVFSKEEVEYQTALDNVVFKGFKVEKRKYATYDEQKITSKKLTIAFYNNVSLWTIKNEFKTIEDLIPYNLEVNENIIKKFGL